jgi:hypothetical protein
MSKYFCLKKLVLLAGLVLFLAPLASADWFLNFEEGKGKDGQPIISGISGVQFSADWAYGDITTGNWQVHSVDLGLEYLGGYYNMYGYVFAYTLGNEKKITFPNADGSYFETRYCSGGNFYLEAYDISGNLLDSDWGPANRRYLEGATDMGTLRVESASHNIAYVVMHNAADYWIVDNMRGDASSSCPSNQGTLQGTVTANYSYAYPIAGASVSALQGDQVKGSASTLGNGSYKMCLNPGTYNVVASKNGYIPDTSYSIALTAGQVTVEDFSLDTNWSQPPVEVKIDSFLQNTPTDTIAFTYSVKNNTSEQIVVSGVVTADGKTIDTFSWPPIGPDAKEYSTQYYLLPESTWENKTIKVEVTEIDYWPTSVKDEIQLSVFYLVDKDGLPYSMFKDAYSFKNFRLDKRQADSVLTAALGTNRKNNKYLIPYAYCGTRGHCYGMAYSSGDYFQRPYKKPHTVRDNTTYQMERSNPEVVYYIILYHLYQNFTRGYWEGLRIQGDVAEHRIAEWLKDNKSNVLGFGLNSPDKCWKHAVNPYKIIRFHTEHNPNDSSWIYMYDNNRPNQIMARSFRPPTGWFDLGGANYINNVDIVDDIYYDDKIKIAHQTFIYNWFQYHSGQQPSALRQGSYTGELLSFALGGSDRLLITNKLGQRTGYVNGTDLVNEIPDAEIYAGGGTSDTNYAVVIDVPKDDGYTISMFGQEATTLSMRGQKTDTLDIVAICPETDSTTTNFLYMDLPVVSGSQGTIQYDPRGASILSLDLNGDGSPDTSIAPLVGMAPFPFDLLWPIKGQRVNATFPLRWNSSLNMDYQDTIFYRAYFAKDSLFSSSESTVVSRDTVTSIGNLDINTTYYWKVKAFDTQGNSICSQVDSFHVVTFKPGDANADGKLTVSDVIYIINYLFKGGPASVPIEAGDANYDGKITVSDVIYLINYLFKGGPAPACL